MALCAYPAAEALSLLGFLTRTDVAVDSVNAQLQKMGIQKPNAAQSLNFSAVNFSAVKYEKSAHIIENISSKMPRNPKNRFAK